MEDKIGKRIKYFRKRKGITQSEVELESGLNFGVISRIENGQINPRRSTVKKIARVLELNTRELDYLVGITSEPATPSEIESALKTTKKFFDDPTFFGYLADDRWIVHDGSKLIKNLLNVDKKLEENIRGKTIIEIMLEDDSHIRKKMGDDTYEEVVNLQLRKYFEEVSFMKDDEYFQRSEKVIMQNEYARNIWEKLKLRDFTVHHRDLRYVGFKIFGKEFKLNYSREHLLNNPRFYLIEYEVPFILSKILSRKNV